MRLLPGGFSSGSLPLPNLYRKAMSNKKRRNRKAASGSSGSTSSNSSPTQTNVIDGTPENYALAGQAEDSSQAASVDKTGLIAYLKANLWMVGIICFLALGVLGSGLKYLDEEARREIARRANSKGNLNNQLEQSFLNKVNPFLPSPTPTPTPQLTRKYIYAGSQLLAVEDANATAAPPSDLAIWRPSNGEWWVMAGTGSQQVTQAWGISTDKPVPGDYDGDGKTDFAVWRPSDGNWYIINSSGGGGQLVLGVSTDLPAPADYDGDGRTDAAVYRPTNGTWYIQQSSDYQVVTAQFGVSADIPAPADYNGDGKADIAVWRNTDQKFYWKNDSGSGYQEIYIGQGGLPVSADYDGDGRANFAIKNGADWVIMNSALSQVQTTSWQQAGDKAVQNDYDGDGKVDIAVWHDTTGTWYIKNSADNSTRTVQWGVTGDTPVPAYYRR